MACLLPGLLCCATLLAQTPSADNTTAPVDPADYQRIEATRARETAAFDAQEAACYKHFAVSGCVKEVQSARRAMLADLRRQEALLHEREFAQQAAEQRRRTEQKALDRKQQEAEAKAQADEAADKLQAQKEKQGAHAAKVPASGAAGAKPAPTGPSAAEQASNRSAFERKQQEAEKKRQDLAKRLADKPGKAAAPLPLPP